MKVIFFLFALLLPSVAFAIVSPEICGNGIDDPLETGGSANGTRGSCPAGYADSVVGLGCDLLCAGVDKDNDGYTSDCSLGTAGTTQCDCDDTTKMVIPGAYVPNSWSSPTGYKKCQADGTYSAVVLTATTPLCEATGGANCKYIDCSAGNNSNAGTHAAPYLTLSKVAGGSSGAAASPYTMGAGDFIYLLGSGTCETTMVAQTTSYSGSNVVLEATQDGTLSAPITIKRYPGSTATVHNANGPGIVVSGDNIKFDDMKVDAQRTSALNASVIGVNGKNITVDRSFLGPMLGHGDNNDACFSCSHTNGCKIFRSWLKNCSRSTGNVDNIAAIKWLDDRSGGALSTQCQDHESGWVTIWWTSYNATNNGMCWKEKHGCDAVDVGPNKHKVHNGSCVNGRLGFWWEGSAFRINDNVIVGAEGKTLYICLTSSAQALMDDMEFNNNTAIDSGPIHWVPPYVSTTQKLTLLKNVKKDIKNPYVAGDNEGVISINGYGTSSQRTSFEANGNLVSDYICAHNPNTTPIFSYFAQGVGNPGGNWNLGQWRTGTGKDLNSVVGDPLFNVYLEPTAPACVATGAGRRLTYSTGGAEGAGKAAFMPFLQ